MPRSARRKVEATSPGKGSSSSTQRTHLENSLFKIFSSLAHLLLRNGYGFGIVNSVAKVAFVDAARSIEQGGAKPKKASIASIATATGLTRVEVARIERSLRTNTENHLEQQNRAVRVAQGWSSDREFLHRNGRPKILPFTGGNASFDRLVRRYSGDIPTRAMLKEMQRLSLVKHTEGDTVSLVRANLLPTKATLSALGAIAPWVRVLAATTEVGEAAELDSSTNRFTMHFESLPQAHAVMREIEGRKAAFIDALAHLSTETKTRNTHTIAISVAIASTKPKHSKVAPRLTRGTK
jgi:hypothetical protein